MAGIDSGLIESGTYYWCVHALYLEIVPCIICHRRENEEAQESA